MIGLKTIATGERAGLPLNTVKTAGDSQPASRLKAGQ